MQNIFAWEKASINRAEFQIEAAATFLLVPGKNFYCKIEGGKLNIIDDGVCLLFHLLLIFWSRDTLNQDVQYNDKKEKIIFLINKEIQRDRVQSHIWLTASS